MDQSEDMVMMRDGRMMVIRNGETMPMEEELTMAPRLCQTARC